jgi:hypothetical protein
MDYFRSAVTAIGTADNARSTTPVAVISGRYPTSAFPQLQLTYIFHVLAIEDNQTILSVIRSLQRLVEAGWAAKH